MNRVSHAVLLCAWTAAGAAAQDVRSYDAKFTNSAPTINGQLDGGEWSSATDPTGDFRLLGTSDPGTVDAHGTAWQALWDSSNLYLLVTSTYDFWPANPGGDDVNAGLDFTADSLTLLFDPNRDDEPNVPDGGGPIYEQVDGYEISFNQWGGASEFRSNQTNSLGGMTVDGFVGGAFFGETPRGTIFDDDAGEYAPFARDVEENVALPNGVVIAQNNDASGSFVELQIPWSFFDAWLPDGGDPDATPSADADVSGLFLEAPPVNGDEWFFNVGRSTTDGFNQFPAWNYTQDFSFYSHPHGLLTFSRDAPNGYLGDYNADGKVDLADFNILKTNFNGPDDVLAEDSHNDDGVIDLADFNALKANFNTSAPVPEPSTIWLAIAAAASLAGLARRRRL